MEKRKGPRSSHRQIEIVHLKNHVIVLIVLLKNPSDSKDSWWMIAGESPPSCGHKATEHPGCYSVVVLYMFYAFTVVFLMFPTQKTQTVLHLQHHGTEAHTLAFLLWCSCLRFELSACQSCRPTPFITVPYGWF